MRSTICSMKSKSQVVQFGPWRVRQEDISYFLLIISVLEADGVNPYTKVSDVRKYLNVMKGLELGVEDNLRSLLSQITNTSLDDKCVTCFGYEAESVLAKNQYKCFLSRIDMPLADTNAPLRELRERIVNEREYDEKFEIYLSNLINSYLPFPIPEINFRKAQPGSGAIAEDVSCYGKSWTYAPVVDRAISTLRQPSRATRAISIAKTWKSRRVIAPEPFISSLYQGCIAEAMVRQIEKLTPCRIHDQEVNRSHCYHPFATIDQSSASDNIRLHHIRHFIPDWAPMLEHHRTKYCIIGEEEVPLGTFFATMGSRLSFPTETIIFWRVAAATLLSLNAPQQAIDELFCYGDDLVCWQEYAPAIMYAFTKCGFQCNVDKTHYRDDDLYRETCGAETFDSFDVRPVRLPRGTRVNWFGHANINNLCEFITNLSMRGFWFTAKILTDGCVQAGKGLGIASFSDLGIWPNSNIELSLPEYTCYSPLSESRSPKLRPTTRLIRSKYSNRKVGIPENPEQDTDPSKVLRHPKDGKLFYPSHVNFDSYEDFYLFFQVWSMFIGYTNDSKVDLIPSLSLFGYNSHSLSCGKEVACMAPSASYTSKMLPSKPCKCTYSDNRWYRVINHLELGKHGFPNSWKR